MFGAHFYGFVDSLDLKGFKRISFLVDKMDKNDFMFSNSPYSLEYVKRTSHVLVVENENSSPLATPMYDSPRVVPSLRQRERGTLDPKVTNDPSIMEIDELGTNMFQVYMWMTLSTTSVEEMTQDTTLVEQTPLPAETVGRLALQWSILGQMQQPAAEGEDVEMDTKFEE